MSERIITYQLAQELSINELKEVSGGGGTQTTFSTVGGSVDTYGNYDAKLDVRFDT